MKKITFVIDWDTEENGEVDDPKSLGLPEEVVLNGDIPACFARVITHNQDFIDALVEELTEEYCYCVKNIYIHCN